MGFKSMVVPVLIVWFGCLSNVTAYMKNDGVTNRQVINCPSKAVCVEQSSGSLSCQGDGVFSKYWTFAGGVEDAPSHVRKGNYQLKNVFAFINRGNDVGGAVGRAEIRCEYKYTDSYPFPTDDIRFRLKLNDGDHFVPLVKSASQASNWNEAAWVDGVWPALPGKTVQGKYQICDAIDSSLCPLIESQYLTISSYISHLSNDWRKRTDLDMEYFINGRLITSSFTNIGYVGNFVDDGKQVFFTYDKLSQACGSLKQCDVYIRQVNDISDNYGVVSVDLTNGIKISNVKSAERIPARRNGEAFKIVKSSLFNTVIMIGY